MLKVSDFITRNVQVVRPDESLRRAAPVTDELDVGARPVCDEQGLVGRLSDPSTPDRSST
jgi:hypothetical protein